METGRHSRAAQEEIPAPGTSDRNISRDRANVFVGVQHVKGKDRIIY